MIFAKTKLQPHLEKLHYFSVLAMVFVFPFNIHFANVFIAISLILWFLQISKINLSTPKNKAYLFATVLFFLLYSASYFFSDNKHEALKSTQKLIYFIIFPFVILSENKHFKNNTNTILSFFILGNILVLLICYFNAFANSFQLESGKLIFQTAINEQYSFWESISADGNYFFYSSFSVFQHTSYFAMFLNFAIVTLIYLKFNRTNKNNDKITVVLTNKFLLVFLISLFGISIFLLSSKINIFITILLFIVFLGTLKIQYKNIIIVFFITISSLIFFSNPRTISIFSGKYTSTENIEKSTAKDRLSIWKNTLELSSENLWFGVGTGDAKVELKKKYKENGYKFLSENGRNAHNVFLQTLLETGVFGLLSIVLIFISILYFSIKNRNLLLFSFMIIIFANFLVENMMSRLAGIYFYSFFVNFLVFSKIEKINLRKYFQFKPFSNYKKTITFLLATIIVASIAYVQINKYNKKISEKKIIPDLTKEKPFVGIFYKKIYDEIAPNNLWTQKMYWELPETDKNTSIPFKIETKKHGFYTLNALIKYYSNDCTNNPRITINANYTDGSFEQKSNSKIIKNNEWEVYSVNIKTDTLKELESISGWILDHGNPSGKKLVKVKFIDLKKYD